MKISALLFVIFLSFVVVQGANASVLNFDDITTESVADFYTYGGLTWANVYTFKKGTPDVGGDPRPGYDNGVKSGEYAAVKGYYGDPSVTSNSGPFDFNGAYLTAAWNNDLNIEFIGQLDGEEKYRKTVTVNTTAPTWCDFNFLEIDELLFSADGGTAAWPNYHAEGYEFVIDDFTINEPVPIPSAIWLLGSGLIGIVGLGRKFRRV